MHFGDDFIDKFQLQQPFLFAYENESTKKNLALNCENEQWK